MKLTINNSFSRIEGLSEPAFKALREKLSYRIDPREAFFGGQTRSPKRYLLSKRGDFPTGLLNKVESFILDYPKYDEVVNWKVPPAKQVLFREATFGKKSPRNSQLRAEYSTELHHRGIVRMPTRSGKSLVMALIIQKHQVKTLIIVPSVGLREQLRKDMLEWFGETPDIVIENIDSARLMNLTNFDMLILDEAHHAAAKTYRDLNKRAWGKIYYRYFFTATPFRSNSEEQLLMESITGQIIFSMNYQDALKEGCVVPVEAYYVDVPEVAIDSNHWRDVLNEGIIHHAGRNVLIAQIMAALAPSGSTLCLVKEIAHGRNLEVLTGFPFANGQDGEVRMRTLEFNLRETKGLIGTSGVLGEGMTLPPCEYVLIAGGGKSRIQLVQNIGRALGLYPGKESAKIILFRDTSHKFLRRHFNAQLKTLREEFGVKPVKLEVS